MLKKLGFFCLIAIALMGYAKAEPGGFDQQPSAKDTADVQIKDSLRQETVIEATDPKNGFKDLFTSPAASLNTIGTEKLNPLVFGFVEDYIAKSGKKTEAMKEWGKPYFDLMDIVLAKHGLPKELKYLAVVESELKTNARSWVGAVGPWQFMPTTARGLGLKINRNVDERRDVYKSTHAASRYLASLFSMYGDWLLVLAAYNGGPGKVNAAIKRSGSRDYWTLQKYLPAESRKHVKKYIAIHYIMEGGGGITTLTKSEVADFMLAVNNDSPKEEPANSVMQQISGRYNSSVIVKHIEMDILIFNKINPDFDKEIAFNGIYELRLPAEKMDIFLTKKTDILNESMQLLLNAETVAAGTR